MPRRHLRVRRLAACLFLVILIVGGTVQWLIRGHFDLAFLFGFTGSSLFCQCCGHVFTTATATAATARRTPSTQRAVAVER